MISKPKILMVLEAGFEAATHRLQFGNDCSLEFDGIVYPYGLKVTNVVTYPFECLNRFFRATAKS